MWHGYLQCQVRRPSLEVEPGPVLTPPYVSFNTFRTLLDWLKTEGVPLRLDRSYWHVKFSGSTGTQLMSALRFLDLLAGDRPSQDLENMAYAPPDERRVILRELMKDAYTAVPFDELDRATPAMVRRWFRSYPVDGHTLRKAISFFVNAARDAEMPMSNAVRKMAKTRATPTSLASREPSEPHRPGAQRAAARGQTARPVESAAGPIGADALRSGHTTIPLEGGGVVSLDLSVDLFRLSDRDRQFVLGLVDLARAYQERQAERGEEAADATEPETGSESTGV